VWYLSGSSSTEWIAKYASFWRQISDDGVTANSAYGARIFRPHRRVGAVVDETWTQWQYVIDELKADNDSRRAVIHVRSPYDSILAKKDVPCTVSLQFLLREDRLHLHVNMRSSDLILGLPYDVPAFTMFQELMAHELTRALERHIDLGEYVHTSASLHVYEKHFEMVERILDNKLNRLHVGAQLAQTMPPMPEHVPLAQILAFEEALWKTRVVNEAMQVYVERPSTHPFWADWFTLLACKRLSNMGDNEAANRLLGGTYYTGYQFFAR
jgi:thymidylate synthase